MRLTAAAQQCPPSRRRICVVGSGDETPFTRVPKRIDGSYEPSSPYTIEGQIDQYGQFARGVSRRSLLARIVVGAIVVGLLALMLYVPFSN